MILEKIQKFRTSPNRTVLTFSKSDSFAFSKKKDLVSSGKDVKICFCNDNGKENSTGTDALNGGTEGENGGISGNGAQNDAQSDENAQNRPANAQNDSEGVQSTNETKNASAGSEKVPSSSQSQSKNNAITGDVSLSLSCNVLLCDLIAGMGALCFVGKIIREIKRMF